jgi:hypothetical protein
MICRFAGTRSFFLTFPSLVFSRSHRAKYIVKLEPVPRQMSANTQITATYVGTKLWTRNVISNCKGKVLPTIASHNITEISKEQPSEDGDLIKERWVVAGNTLLK